VFVKGRLINIEIVLKARGSGAMFGILRHCGAIMMKQCLCVRGRRVGSLYRVAKPVFVWVCVRGRKEKREIERRASTARGTRALDYL